MSAKINHVAELMAEMSHAELTAMAKELVDMQTSAKEDGWEWKPTELYGEYGMIEMLSSWATSKE